MSDTKLTGMLRVFAHVVPPQPASPWHDVVVLAATGTPQSFGRSGTGLEDVDFGDGECKELPDLPNEAGVWVLEWPWRQVDDEDGEPFFD